MNTSKLNFAFSQTLVALAVLAAYSPAQAQETAAPQSSVSVGLGAASGDSKDRARFGMFNGLREHNGHGLLGIDYVNRNASTGLWTSFEGRNLGLDNRELGFSQRKLGDWKYSADYSELVRHDPRTINTGLIGAGTTTPTVVRLPTPGSGQDLNLDLKRKSFTFAGAKWFGDSLQLEASFKNEDKTGARLFGKGFACSASWVAAGSCTSSTTQWALLMLPEPIDSTIKQFDAKLNYSTDKLLLTGGYYGSFYNNGNSTLTPNIPGTLNNPLGAATALDAGLRTTLGLAMALPPDSQSHQYYLQGNYRFTPTTRLTFKYSYSHATQNEGFAIAGAPAGRSNLGGVMNTTLGQLGFTTRPMNKLTLTANLRYESKDNKTPIDYYNIEGRNRFTNGNPSPKKLAAKVEASYQLPQNYRATLGVDYESVDHGMFTPTDNVAGISGLKQKTEEKGYRLELRRAMSETFTGAVSYVSSRREGNSPWLKPYSLTNTPPQPNTGVLEASAGCTSATVGGIQNACIYGRTSIFPFIFEDRQRDKLKFLGSWTPTNRLILQFFVEDGKDKFHGPTEHGLRDSGMRMLSVDAAYSLSDAWKLTGYLSRGEQTVNAGHSTGYDATLRDTADSLGIGLVGKPSARFQVGGDLTYLNDLLKYQQTLDPLGSATNAAFLAQQGGLPDVTYRLLRLKVFGQYSLDKSSSIRVDLIHQRTLFNEWTYNYNGVPFTYSDNTTLNAQQNQAVTFVGASYIYKFQ